MTFVKIRSTFLFLLLAISFLGQEAGASTDQKDMDANDLPKMMPRADYSKQFKVSGPSNTEPGYQGFHTKTTNKPYREDPIAVDFVTRYLQGAKQLVSDA